jgi:hypothetical protein
MTWDGLVTTYHQTYRKSLNLNNHVEAYIQSRVLRMTLESLTMDSRRGTASLESLQEAESGTKTPDLTPEIVSKSL